MSDYTILKQPEKGFCVFSNKKYYPGDYVGEYLTQTKNNIGRYVKGNFWETILGRYCNHSNDPNSTVILEKDVYFLIVIKPIDIGDEITLDYRVIEKLFLFDEGFFLNMDNIVPPLKKYGITPKNGEI